MNFFLVVLLFLVVVVWMWSTVDSTMLMPVGTALVDGPVCSFELPLMRMVVVLDSAVTLSSIISITELYLSVVLCRKTEVCFLELLFYQYNVATCTIPDGHVFWLLFLNSLLAPEQRRTDEATKPICTVQHRVFGCWLLAHTSRSSRLLSTISLGWMDLNQSECSVRNCAGKIQHHHQRLGSRMNLVCTTYHKKTKNQNHNNNNNRPLHNPFQKP